MRHLGDQEGSSLILLIGVIAAVAIMTSSLAVLISNVQHNTSQDRQRAKAFNVTEAALDNALYQLASGWPKDSASAPTFDTTAFRAKFSTGEFPNPTSGQFSTVVYYDNSDTNGDGRVGYTTTGGWDAGWDVNGDSYMYIEAQGMTGSGKARIKALAMRTTFNLDVPRGVALYCESDLWMHGGGLPVGVEVPPPGGGVTAWVGGQYQEDGGTTLYNPQITPRGPNLDGSAMPALSDILSPEILDGLVQSAQASGRYFTSVAAAEASPMGLEGLCVIDLAGDVTITSNEEYNGDGVGANEPPGILIVRGGNVTFHGDAVYWGLLYVEGGFVDIGGAEIHGMVAGTDPSQLGGSEQILYNDNVMINLNRVLTLTVKIVPNSWREIKPI